MSNYKYQTKSKLQNVKSDKQRRLNLKFVICNLKFSQGFTLIELLVVISIMLLILTSLVINLNGQSAERDMKIATNQLATDIRKTQSYTLSARTLPGGQSASYYLVKFDFGQPDRYTIQAIINAQNNPQVVDVETVKFPAYVVLQSVAITPPGQSQTTYTSGCQLVAFKLPFGKPLADGGGGTCGNYALPHTIASTEAYNDILTYINNASNVHVSSDFNMVITLLNQRNGSLTNTSVTVSGLTGTVSQ